MNDEADTEHDAFEPLAMLAAEQERLAAGEQPKHGRERRGEAADIQFIREVMYGLHDVSIGTHQLLYFAAMKYCKNYLDLTATTVAEAVDELQDMFDQRNIGTLTMQESADGKILLSLEENALTVDAETDKPICYFLSGYIAGCLENAVGDHFVVNEISCVSQGEDACIFRAQRR